MGQKVKQEKNQISLNNEANTSPRPWPNLPKELTSLISGEHRLMDNISFGGVTKSWRSVQSRKCSTIGKSLCPQLTEIQENKNHSHCFPIWFRTGYYWPYGRRWRTWKDPWIYFKGHSHGALIAVGRYPDDIFLWKSYRETFSFLFCKTGEGNECNWTKQDCDLTDPFGLGENLQFANAIGFNGKFYALSLQGTLAVIEEIDSSLTVTGMSSKRAVPSVISRQFREYLVESDGEILLIFLISKRCIKTVDDVEVYRLDIAKLLWVKMESLGHRTLFVEEECCMWIDASKLGCRSSCIYFTQKGSENWWMFDMQAKAISPASESNLFAIESLMEN